MRHHNYVYRLHIPNIIIEMVKIHWSIISSKYDYTYTTYLEFKVYLGWYEVKLPHPMFFRQEPYS